MPYDDDTSRGQAIQRTGIAATAFVKDVGVNHGRTYILVAEQLQNSADVVSTFDKVGCKRVAKRVSRDTPHDPGPLNGSLNSPLHGRSRSMMPALHPGTRVD